MIERERSSQGVTGILEIVSASEVGTTARLLATAAHELFAADAEVSVVRDATPLAHARVGQGPTDGEERHFVHTLAATHLTVELTLRAMPSAPIESSVTSLLAIAAASMHKLCLVSDARNLARERQEIVALVSHDLRTPLQSLGLGLDALDMLVAGTMVATSCAGTIARMQRSVATMGRILGDLLDVSRIHDGALSIHMRTCDTSQLISELAAQHTPLAAARGLAFEVSATDAGLLVCDARRVTQAVSNLLANAIRHATRGPLRLRVSRHEARVRFEVEDAGPGIPPEVCARLFDRLHPVEGSGGRSGGLGLGLYIAKGIVAAHGGSIGVESEVGRGSTFWIELDEGRSVAPRRDERGG